MRKILPVLMLALAACTQADPDQYKALGPAPVGNESNGWFYDATNDRLAGFVNDTEVIYITSAGNVVADGTITEGAQALNDDTSTTYGTGSDSIIQYAASGADPDSLFIGVGTDSRQLIIAETGDVATDMAIAQQTNPTLMIHSADATDAADYIMLAHDQTNGVIDVGQGSIAMADGVWMTDDLDLYLGASNDMLVTFDKTNQAPDSAVIGVGSESRQLVIMESADIATDLTIAQQTNPSVNIHSADATDANDYIMFAHDQTDGIIDVGQGQIRCADDLALTDDLDIDLGASDDALISFDATAQAPDSLIIGVGTESRQLVIMETADVATDLTIAQQTNPTLNIHSADATDANDYITIAHDQTNGVIAVGQGQVSIPAGITSSKTGGDVLTCTGNAPTITLTNNQAAALSIKASGTATDWIVFDTTTNAEELTIKGDTGVSSFRVDTGTATFDEIVTLTAGFTSSVTAADAITLTGAAPTITLKDNEGAALNINSSGTSNFFFLDTTTNAEEVNINGVAATSAFRVDTGLATFDEEIQASAGMDADGVILCGGGAGAVTFDAASSSVLMSGAADNAAAGLDIGATGATTMMRFDTQDNAENVEFGNGVIYDTIALTGAPTLDASDCGTYQFVTDAHDGSTITLPATIPGCVFVFMFVGSDGGALVDISPNASDAIHGSCTLAASVVEFSGADNADIGLTKATANTGDTITLVGDSAGEGWYVVTCTGIWANN